MTDELDLEQGVADGLEPGEGLASPEEGLAPSDDRPPLELTETALEALLFVAERPLSRREIASLAGPAEWAGADALRLVRAAIGG